MSTACTLPQVWARNQAVLKKPAGRVGALQYAANLELPARQAIITVPVSSVAFYRRYTELLLRRYMQVSMRMGRVPSVLGNCMFRGKVSSYRVQSFEDAVIFVYDVDKCLKQLNAEETEIIARIALQEYTQGEAAELTGQSLRSVVRKYGDAVDKLTTIFLEKDLLAVGPLYGGSRPAV